MTFCGDLQGEPFPRSKILAVFIRLDQSSIIDMALPGRFRPERCLLPSRSRPAMGGAWPCATTWR